MAGQRTTKGPSKNKKTNSKARAVKNKREGAKARDLVTLDGLNGDDIRSALLAPAREETPLVPTIEKKPEPELEKGGESLASVLKELEMSL